MEIENSLYDLKGNAPAKFVRICQDKHLKMKAEIEEMVSSQILRKIGNQIIYQDEVLGETLQNAVIYLNDKKNSGKLTTLRAKLKEVTV